jgi:hypothetical protein
MHTKLQRLAEVFRISRRSDMIGGEGFVSQFC